MKSSTYIIGILFLFASGCGPENKQVTDNQIETGSANEVMDTVANTRPDGVDTEANDSISPEL